MAMRSTDPTEQRRDEATCDVKRRPGGRQHQVFAATLCVLGAGWACAFAQPPAPVAVDAIRMESVTRMHRITGEIAPRRRATVATEEAGLVLVVPFDAGERIAAGDILAELDADILQLTLREQEAELAQAKAIVEERRTLAEWAQRDLESLEDLLRQGAAKTKEVEDKRSEMLAARASQRQAEEAAALAGVRMELIKRRLRNKTIRAPFDGVVIVKSAEVGQWVPIGGSICEIIEIDAVDAVLDVPEWLVGQLQVGMSLEILPAAFDETVQGSIRTIVPQSEGRARTYPVKVGIENPQHRLMPGMALKGWVPSREFDEAITVHRDAVLTSPTGPYVYAVRDGAAMPVNIEIRSSAGVKRFVISGPLSPGDRVVIEGNEKLYPTARVNIVRDETPASGDAGAAGRGP